MPTLQEILEQDMGMATEKTASDNSNFEDPELHNLATELGLFEDSEKVAADDNDDDDEEDDRGYDDEDENENNEKDEEKSASAGSLYESLFGEDELGEKTAGEDKEAAAMEEALGARAYDYFTDRFERRIEKMAKDVLSGNATISAPTASGEESGNPHQDARPPQASKTNKPRKAKEKIDTDPVYTDEVNKGTDARVSGKYEQKKTAALRKHLLMSEIEDGE